MGSNFQRHSYHLVDYSPWPVLASIGVFSLMSGSVLMFNGFAEPKNVALYGLLYVIVISILWWRDVIREGTYEGHHTLSTQLGLRLGMVLFIVSEVFFFLGFFWAFFHSSLAPTVELGSVWPPVGLKVFNPWEVPLLNTFVLLLSGATITWAHNGLIISRHDQVLLGLGLTVGLAVFFTLLQLFEYISAHFDITDGVYGSVFFMATGFHGAHVIIGTIFISVCFLREVKYHYSKEHHFGFEAAAWYWHFVDVVWLFLFVSVYWWGNS
jgi:cytochrome c oxidase subunit 3